MWSRYLVSVQSEVSAHVRVLPLALALAACWELDARPSCIQNLDSPAQGQATWHLSQIIC